MNQSQVRGAGSRIPRDWKRGAFFSIRRAASSPRDWLLHAWRIPPSTSVGMRKSAACTQQQPQGWVVWAAVRSCRAAFHPHWRQPRTVRRAWPRHAAENFVFGGPRRGSAAATAPAEPPGMVEGRGANFGTRVVLPAFRLVPTGLRHGAWREASDRVLTRIPRETAAPAKPRARSRFLGGGAPCSQLSALFRGAVLLRRRAGWGSSSPAPWLNPVASGVV